jgi:hypothetical protein
MEVMVSHTINAILFIPTGGNWMDLCAQYTARHGYQIIAVVSVWADAIGLAREHAAVVVAGRREHLPADRLPRLEIVVEEGDTPANAPMRHRPRRTSAVHR